jgi:hydroxymethylbilane synthase
MPIGAFAQIMTGDEMSITSIVVSTDGSRSVRATVQGSVHAPEQLGRQAADTLLADGAESILVEARRALSETESHHQ